MTDIELDDILNSWSAPQVPASLRERVRRAAIRPERAPWVWRKGLWGAVAAGLAAMLVVTTLATPQTLPAIPPPYTVQSEFLQYASDGSATVGMLVTSFNDAKGREVVLSKSIPGNPAKTAILRGVEATLRFASPLLLRLAGVTDAQLAARRAVPFASVQCADSSCLFGLGGYTLPAAAANPGIGCVEGAAFDRTMILGYPTAAIQVAQGERQRMTVWMAPALGCFALKIATEQRGSDGIFHLVSGKQAIGVTLNPY